MLDNFNLVLVSPFGRFFISFPEVNENIIEQNFFLMLIERDDLANILLLDLFLLLYGKDIIVFEQKFIEANEMFLFYLFGIGKLGQVALEVCFQMRQHLRSHVLIIVLLEYQIEEEAFRSVLIIEDDLEFRHVVDYEIDEVCARHSLLVAVPYHLQNQRDVVVYLILFRIFRNQKLLQIFCQFFALIRAVGINLPDYVYKFVAFQLMEALFDDIQARNYDFLGKFVLKMMCGNNGPADFNALSYSNAFILHFLQEMVEQMSGVFSILDEQLYVVSGQYTMRVLIYNGNFIQQMYMLLLYFMSQIAPKNQVRQFDVEFFVQIIDGLYPFFNVWTHILRKDYPSLILCELQILVVDIFREKDGISQSQIFRGGLKRFQSDECFQLFLFEIEAWWVTDDVDGYVIKRILGCYLLIVEVYIGSFIIGEQFIHFFFLILRPQLLGREGKGWFGLEDVIQLVVSRYVWDVDVGGVFVERGEQGKSLQNSSHHHNQYQQQNIKIQAKTIKERRKQVVVFQQFNKK